MRAVLSEALCFWRVCLIILLSSIVYTLGWAEGLTREKQKQLPSLSTLKQQLATVKQMKPSRWRPLLSKPAMGNVTVSTNGRRQEAIVMLHYRRASVMAAWLGNRQTRLLSAEGVMRADQHDNALFILDTPAHVQQMQRLLRRLDRPPAQFLIRAKVVSVDGEAMRTLGALIRYTTATRKRVARQGMSLPEPAPTAMIWRIPLLSGTAGQQLSVELAALEKTGRARLMASPKLITLNGQSAEIATGEEVPYQQGQANGATTTQFKQAELRLRVTPYRLPHRQVRVTVEINQDKVSGLMIHGVPAIHTQRLVTQIRLHDRQSVVIGGILEQHQTWQVQRWPVLHRIPVLGYLFKHRYRHWRQRQLLIVLSLCGLNEDR